MKLYIAIRWGNNESPDGPDGEDTHFLVRASDHIEAARLSDEALCLIPKVCIEGHRSVRPFCDKIIEIGSDSSTMSAVEPQVLVGPWTAYGYAVHQVGYMAWSRNDHSSLWDEEIQNASIVAASAQQTSPFRGNMHYSENAIRAAAFLFEKWNGNQLGDIEANEIERQGLSEIDPELVAKELSAAVCDDAKTDSTYRQQAYWALGKRYDANLIPFFRERLAVELRRDLIAAYQIMIALDNLEQPVFSEFRDGSVTMHEYDLNRMDGEAYLDGTSRVNQDAEPHA